MATIGSTSNLFAKTLNTVAKAKYWRWRDSTQIAGACTTGLFSQSNYPIKKISQWQEQQVSGDFEGEKLNIKADDEIPSLNIPSVDPQRMKTMAALLRDPYPIHWDAEGNEKMGIKGNVVNQGPLNLSYLVNMLMNWQGQDCIRRLTVRFTGWVLDGDSLSAHGKVISLNNTNDELLAKCEIWLERDGERLLQGEAIVALTDS